MFGNVTALGGLHVTGESSQRGTPVTLGGRLQAAGRVLQGARAVVGQAVPLLLLFNYYALIHSITVL